MIQCYQRRIFSCLPYLFLYLFNSPTYPLLEPIYYVLLLSKLRHELTDPRLALRRLLLHPFDLLSQLLHPLRLLSHHVCGAFEDLTEPPCEQVRRLTQVLLPSLEDREELELLVQLIKLLLHPEGVAEKDLAGVRVGVRFLLVRGHKLHNLVSDARFTSEEFLLNELQEVRRGIGHRVLPRYRDS